MAAGGPDVWPQTPGHKMACHFLFLFSLDQSPWGEASCRFAETPGNPLERLRRADSGPSAKSQQGMRPPAYDHASAAEGHNRKEF